MSDKVMTNAEMLADKLWKASELMYTETPESMKAYEIVCEVINSLRVGVEAEKIDHTVCPKCKAQVEVEKDGDDAWLECACGWQSKAIWWRQAVMKAIYEDKDHA